MHAMLRILTFLVIGFAVSVRAELVFEQTQIELHPAIGDDTAVAHFKYENKGDKPIAIKSVNSSCGCTAASAKPTANPGEKGEVTATFKIGDRIGLQQKAIMVVTDDPAHPSTTLTLKVDIPKVLDLQPTFVFWQSGEAVKPKTIIAKAGKDVTLKNLEVASSSPDFTTKVEPGTAPGQFQINVEPRQTTQAATATLTIKPVLEKGPAKVFYASARVTPPAQAAAPKPGVNLPISADGAAKPMPVANPPASKPKIDACALLKSAEIQSIQGEALKEAKGSGNVYAGVAVSQCYFMLPTSSNSISLSVMQKGDGTDAANPRQRWQEMFHREKTKEAEREEHEEGEKKSEPAKVAELADEAFWMGTRVGGELYVLKGENYFRISIGGAGDAATKLNKTKALAEIVLKRL